ncbi:sensor histidine kinase [Thermobifida cellulosilytica]|uniref:ATP-binding protein n=1 Tax=Thermobifida cellulosilytica TB100 TaxID=665004 RepID=A0A147KEX3_THECS|nr:histidine kinase [Thermobifida cellulosilytica]KUP95842.1 ATP-binding protein [Thermobifida cellulosilytica TB100]
MGTVTGQERGAPLERLTGLTRLLVQLRFLLTGVALLLLPPERISVRIVLMLVSYAVLSWLLARYWERLSVHVVRHPVLIAADTLVASAILAVVGPSGAFFLATVLTSAAAGVLYGTRGVAGVSAAQIFGYLTALFLYLASLSAPAETFWENIQLVVVQPLLYPTAGYIGLRLRGLFEELALEQERRRAAERAAAAAEERARLARDMHDSVAKTLQGAAMAAQALPIWLRKDPERAAAAAAQVVSAAEAAAQEARKLITDLREGSADLPIADQVATVLREWSETTGIQVELHSCGAPMPLLITARHETVAILREALTNIDRHAAAETVAVELSTDAGHLVMTVRDDGRGFDPGSSAPGHYGLVGMRERAARAGGRLSIDTAPGEGTTVVLRVPLAPPSQSSEDSP